MTVFLVIFSFLFIFKDKLREFMILVRLSVCILILINYSWIFTQSILLQFIIGRSLLQMECMAFIVRLQTHFFFMIQLGGGGWYYLQSTLMMLHYFKRNETDMSSWGGITTCFLWNMESVAFIVHLKGHTK